MSVDTGGMALPTFLSYPVSSMTIMEPLIDGRAAVGKLTKMAPAAEASLSCCLDSPRKALERFRMTAVSCRALLVSQNGVCAICGRGHWIAGRSAPLYIDHDHGCCPNRAWTCGKCVRGLLCAGCNGWLGELELWGAGRREPAWERAALAYLTDRGFDPFATARLGLLGEQHRLRRIKVGMICSCQHCTPQDASNGV
jgi:hypothetical protein